MRHIACALFLLISSFVVAQAQDAPTEVQQKDDPELKDLQWNRYETGKLVVVSIDKELGEKLSESLSEMKSDVLTRWGFPDVELGKECRIFCVPKLGLLTKLFNLSAPRMQARKELYAIWTVLDQDLQKSVAPYLTSVMLLEYEAKEGIALPMWFKRGAHRLASGPDDVRQQLTDYHATARREQFAYTAQKMFMYSEDEYNKQSAENKKAFDLQAMCLCLMLRQELGEAKLQGFLRLQNRNKPESVLRAIYGYDGFTGSPRSFEEKYYDFIKDLTNEAADGKVPDSYLTIRSR